MFYIPIDNRYEIITKIGEGGYGIVYKAREIRTNDIVSLKQIKRKQVNSEEGIPPSILCEIQILQSLKGHSNIINLKDVYISKYKKEIFIVYDYCEFDMNRIIYQQERKLSIQQIKSFFKQMIAAVNEVHSKGFIHCDIKPGNFLISKTNELKLIDFGVSKKIIQKNKNSKIGTINYNAPELIAGDNEYGIEIDIWSLGCTFFEMISKEKLIRSSHSNDDVANQIVQIFGLPNKKDYPQFYSLPNKNLFISRIKCSNNSFLDICEKKFPEECKPLKKLISKMLQLNPKNRISLDDALNDPFLADVELPKKFPSIALTESNFFKGVSLSKGSIKNENFLKNFRPIRIVPPNF